MVWKHADTVYQALTAPVLPRTRIFLIEEGTVDVVLSCRHCEVPPCKEACPADAIRKLEDGTVVIDDGICIGCRSCVVACPLGVIRPDERGQIMVKCDLCKGSDEPVCVTACPTNALVYGEFSQIIRERRGNV